MCDALFGVVNRDRELISKKPVATAYYEVADLRIDIDTNLALDSIFETSDARMHSQANRDVAVRGTNT